MGEKLGVSLNDSPKDADFVDLRAALRMGFIPRPSSVRTTNCNGCDEVSVRRDIIVHGAIIGTSSRCVSGSTPALRSLWKDADLLIGVRLPLPICAVWLANSRACLPVTLVIDTPPASSSSSVTGHCASDCALAPPPVVTSRESDGLYSRPSLTCGPEMA